MPVFIQPHELKESPKTSYSRYGPSSDSAILLQYYCSGRRNLPLELRMTVTPPGLTYPIPMPMGCPSTPRCYTTCCTLHYVVYEPTIDIFPPLDRHHLNWIVAAVPVFQPLKGYRDVGSGMDLPAKAGIAQRSMAANSFDSLKT